MSFNAKDMTQGGQIANMRFQHVWSDCQYYFLRAVYFILGAVRADADVPAQLANLCERLRILVVYDAGFDARYYSFPAGIHHSVLRPVAGIYLRTNPG